MTLLAAILFGSCFGVSMAMAASLYADGDHDYLLYVGGSITSLGLAFIMAA